MYMHAECREYIIVYYHVLYVLYVDVGGDKCRVDVMIVMRNSVRFFYLLFYLCFRSSYSVFRTEHPV